MTRYIVATSQQEARELFDDYGHASRAEAEGHLEEVQAPPTDSYYANQYRIYKVEKP